VQVQPWGMERIDANLMALCEKYDTEPLPEAP
jgi:hypothetical protein